MYRLRSIFGTAATLTGLSLGAVTPATAQTDASPPQIVDLVVSTTSCEAPTPWTFGVDPCPLENQVMFLCLTLTDADWLPDPNDPNGTVDLGEEDGVMITMLSFWIPFVRSGVLYGPEPPCVSTDRPGGESANLFVYHPPPAPGQTTIVVELPFLVPEFVGANQARLRGLVDYDVFWEVELRIWNGSGDSPPGDDDPSSGTFVEICGLENPALNPGNPPPFADAGADQTIGAGSTTTLDGSRSFDASNTGFEPTDPEVFAKDDLTFTWEWFTGPTAPVLPVEDGDGNPATMAVTLITPGTYVYRLLVEDNANAEASTDLVTISVRANLPVNRAPAAIASGPTGTVQVGQLIELDASSSTDPDGDVLAFRWRQTNEVGGELTSSEIADAFQPVAGLEAAVSSWRAVSPGQFYFRLLVTDVPEARDTFLSGQALTDTALISVTVAEAGGGAAEAFVYDADTPGDAADEADGVRTQPLPGACGGLGILPLTVLPGLLWLMRSRYRA